MIHYGHINIFCKKTESTWFAHSRHLRLSSLEAASEAEFIRVINKSPAKSCGIDPIPTQLVKEHAVSLVITRLVNSSLNTGIVPTAFKSALLAHLLNKPPLDEDILKNYRLVSYLPYLSKVLEKIVLSRLLKFLEESGQHEPHQSAYRSAHSTEIALVRVSSDILSALDRREGVFRVLLDLSAAFDTIDRELMLNRLSNIGVKGTALMWFPSFLQDRH